MALQPCGSAMFHHASTWSPFTRYVINCLDPVMCNQSTDFAIQIIEWKGCSLQLEFMLHVYFAIFPALSGKPTLTSMSSALLHTKIAKLLCSFCKSHVSCHNLTPFLLAAPNQLCIPCTQSLFCKFKHVHLQVTCTVKNYHTPWQPSNIFWTRGDAQWQQIQPSSLFSPYHTFTTLRHIPLSFSSLHLSLLSSLSRSSSISFSPYRMSSRCQSCILCTGAKLLLQQICTQIQCCTLCTAHHVQNLIR